MIRFLADENFNRAIVRGLLRRNPAIDLVTAQGAGLRGMDDPGLLDWAAAAGRAVLSHDVSTLVGFAYDRVRAGLPMPGVFEAARSMSHGAVIEELLIIAECSQPGEWEGQVRYLPLR
ncbi:MAG: DUF5615 family PIN-like protein [Gemmataceae bacterium]|nr:DUF5615 family PIN-like protein [Gemmataceae bacterium]